MRKRGTRRSGRGRRKKGRGEEKGESVGAGEEKEGEKENEKEKKEETENFPKGQDLSELIQEKIRLVLQMDEIGDKLDSTVFFRAL